MANMVTGDNTSALADATEAIALDEEEGLAHLVKGYVYIKQDKKEDGCFVLRNALNKGVGSASERSMMKSMADRTCE